MAYRQITAPARYVGSSLDGKPGLADAVAEGSEFYETDTLVTYLWEKDGWRRLGSHDAPADRAVMTMEMFRLLPLIREGLAELRKIRFGLEQAMNQTFDDPEGN